MTARLRKVVGWTAVILLPIAYIAGSEVYYARSISPRGISNINDFFHRFGEPSSIRMVQRQGQSYYEFSGRLPTGFLLSLPSAPPAYVFDQQGRFVTWCRDPGDIPDYGQTWKPEGTNQINVSLLKERFRLH